MLRDCEDGKIQAREVSGLDPAGGDAEAADFDPGDEAGLENRKTFSPLVY